MSIYKRLFCVLLVFVLLSVQFLPLHTVHATENSNIIEIHPEDYQISTLNLTDEDYDLDNPSVYVMSNLYTGTYGKSLIPRDANIFLGGYINYNKNIKFNGFDTSQPFWEQINFEHIESTRLFSKGSQLNIDISNMVNNIEYTDENGSSFKFYMQPSAVKEIQVICSDIGGVLSYVNLTNFNFRKNPNGNYDLSCTIDSLPVDTFRLFIRLIYTYDDAYGWSGLPFNENIIRNSGFVNGRIQFTENTDDGTKGLLANIIALVNNIKDGITNLPSKIASSIKGFFDNVVNAVTNVMNAVTNIGDLIKNAIINLGTFLIDGIKGLFVPSEEDITEMQERWTDLLSDRFGALYQTTELITEYTRAFTNQQKNTITMPTVTIPLADSEFVFGGWEVQVVPDGFEIVFDTLKLIISIVCTIWFVNGLKNRFEKLVGGADNI